MRLLTEEEIKVKMADCMLCPRNCHADRNAGSTGYCGQTADVKAARAALHFWEEPCISGTAGSGTVFFTGCPLRCIYCQNGELAAGHVGITITGERLADVFLKLQEKGANNINLVTPTHFIPQIARALYLAKERGLRIPVVYNTGGYEKPESLRLLEGLVDVYLPDFKYMSERLAQDYSGAADYARWAKPAIEEMVRQVGEPVFRTGEGKTLTAGQWNDLLEEMDGAQGAADGNGPEAEKDEAWDDYRTMPLLQKGVIVRHLVLPKGTEDSKAILAYLYETYGDRIYISIMNQYTPLEQVREHPELSRRVTKAEYEEVMDFALELGLENGFFQDGETVGESFIPDFNGEGIR